MLQLMREMGWSYQEYQATPLRVVRAAIRMLNAEALARKHSYSGGR